MAKSQHGTRLWNISSAEENDKKIINRELIRLELSIQDGIKKYRRKQRHNSMYALSTYKQSPKRKIRSNKTNAKIQSKKMYIWSSTPEKQQMSEQNGNICGIQLELVSADYLNFNPKEI